MRERQKTVCVFDDVRHIDNRPPPAGLLLDSLLRKETDPSHSPVGHLLMGFGA